MGNFVTAFLTKVSSLFIFHVHILVSLCFSFCYYFFYVINCHREELGEKKSMGGGSVFTYVTDFWKTLAGVSSFHKMNGRPHVCHLQLWCTVMRTSYCCHYNSGGWSVIPGVWLWITIIKPVDISIHRPDN